MSFEVVATRRIRAPREVVWSVLTDVKSWHLWSTWLVYEGGEMKVGARLNLRLSPPKGQGYAFSPEVLALDAPHHLAWIGRTGLPGVFDGEHHFVLTRAEAPEETLLENRERYSGLLSPLLSRLPMMQGAEAGFEAMNAELAQRAESLAR